MFRLGQQFGGWPAFDYGPRVEHQNTVSKSGQERGVVRNQHQRETERALKLAEEREDFRLRDGVERSCRLIGDENGWPANNGLRDQHALALASAQFVRVTAGNTCKLPAENGAQSCVRFFAQYACSTVQMRAQHFSHLIAHSHRGMKRQSRLLKDQSNSRAPNASQRVIFSRQEF